MTLLPARVAGASLSLLLTLGGLAACGDDEPAPGEDAASSTPADGAGAESAGEEEDGAEEGDGSGDDEGSVGPAGGVTLVDAVDAPAATVGTSAAGFDPASVSVAVGDVVTFTSTDDGIYGVIVGDLDGYTVAGGLDEAFRFDEPGTYAVREDISGAVATVVVE